MVGTTPAGVTRALRTLALTLALLVVAGFGLAGCSADRASSPGAAPQNEAPEGRGGDADGSAGDPAPPGAPEGEQAPADERSLIYTGTITVRVGSVVQAADEAIAITVGLGGIVAGDTRTIDEDSSVATLILRVPAERFTSALDRFGDLGTESSRQVQAEDVTESLVDLDARIATQQAALDRIRALLARAQTIGEIIALETELTRRQADLDSLTQRRATMAGLVALATITLVLHGPTAAGEEPDEPETGFVAGLRSGWDGFLASVTVVLTVAGWLLPWALAIGGPVLAGIWIARARRRRRARVATPPQA